MNKPDSVSASGRDKTLELSETIKAVYDDSSAESGLSSSDSKSDDFIEPDAKELRRLIWKLDLRIIPYVCILYLCSYLDRVNIGMFYILNCLFFITYLSPRRSRTDIVCTLFLKH